MIFEMEILLTLLFCLYRNKTLLYLASTLLKLDMNTAPLPQVKGRAPPDKIEFEVGNKATDRMAHLPGKTIFPSEEN